MILKQIYVIQIFDSFGKRVGFVTEDGRISTQEFETMDLAHTFLKKNPDRLRPGRYYVPVETFKTLRE